MNSPIEALILKMKGRADPAESDDEDTREARLTLMRKFIKGVSGNKPEMALEALDALTCEGPDEAE